MAVLLILLIVHYFIPTPKVLLMMAGVLVSGMVVPKLYTPVAFVWFGFSNLLGGVVSKLLMGLLFFAVVTPMGLVRRCLGKDAMRLKGWKKSDESVFVVRDYQYSAKDLEHPY